MVFHLLCNLFNENDIQILVWIATCGVHMAESLLTGPVFTFHRVCGS